MSRLQAPGHGLQGYDALLGDVTTLLEEARRQCARAVNTLMTATYWAVGRRIVGFGQVNVSQMRRFYLTWTAPRILQTASKISASGILQTQSEESRSAADSSGSASFVPRPSVEELATRFPLPWSQYIRLMTLRSDEARAFYEQEALCGGGRAREEQLAGQAAEGKKTPAKRGKGKKKAPKGQGGLFE